MDFEFGKSYDELEIGEEAHFSKTIKEKMEEKRWVRMALTWMNQRGETVAEGEAVVIPSIKKQ